MFLPFLAILASFTISGAYGLICLTGPIKAEEGGSVTLQCRLDPSANLVNYTLDWKRTDLELPGVVHSYQHYRNNSDAQLEQYRGRTSLNHEDLSRGIVTLQISSVKASDSGTYKCLVRKFMSSGTIDLHVGKRDQQNDRKTDTPSTTRPPLEDNSDGENLKYVPAGVIFGVVLVLVALGLKCGWINKLKNFINRLRGRRQQEEEAASNGSAMQMLNTQASERVEDGLGNFI